MSSARPAYKSAPSYNELESLLARADAVARAAECHGIICGVVCAGAKPDEFAWMDYVLQEDERTQEIGRDCVCRLKALAQAELERFDKEDFSFEPMLPEDNQPLSARLSALSEWCAGFLFGFGSVTARNDEPISGLTQEFIGDLANFTRVDADVMQQDEEDESAYLEIVEYIKAGSLLVRDASFERARRSGSPERKH